MADSSDEDREVPENGDHVVPGNVLQNLDLRVITKDLPDPDSIYAVDQMEDLGEDIGEVRTIQLATRDGQGLYFTANIPDHGHVLIKYLEGGYYRRLVYAYNNLGVPIEVLENFGWAEWERTHHREVTFAQELLHPNIARIIALFSPTGMVADVKGLIMEGAADGVLETYARNHSLSDDVVRNLGRQGAAALKYCHDRQIMHRDIRPRNFYVHNGGTVLKLGNFGYARRGGPVLISANRGEELWYKAPEIINIGNLAEYSYPVDVYSFGLVMWSMAHGGRRPYKDEGVAVNDHSRFKQYLQIEGENDEAITHRPTIRSDLDERLVRLMRRCWVTYPASRPRIHEVEAGL